MIAVMSVASTPHGCHDISNWADSTAFLITAASVTSLLYFGARLLRGRYGLGGEAALPILAVPPALLAIGVALALMTAMGFAAVSA